MLFPKYILFREKATLSILSEMISSMQKSKDALSKLAIVEPEPMASSKALDTSMSNKHVAQLSNIRPDAPLNSVQMSSLEPDMWATEVDDYKYEGESGSPDRLHFTELEQQPDNVFNETPIEAFTPAMKVLDSSNGDDDAYEDGVGYARSPGAALNASYTKQKNAEFSARNKYLLEASANDYVDPVERLQQQILQTSFINPLSSSTRSWDTTNTGLNMKFHFDSKGYVWDGTRYSRGQGLVARLCITGNALQKVTL